MINEEDHLRIQFLKTGFSLRSVWKQSTDLILAWKMSSTSPFLLSLATHRLPDKLGYRPTCLCNVASAWTRNF
jgi:protein-arginine kinase